MNLLNAIYNNPAVPFTYKSLSISAYTMCQKQTEQWFATLNKTIYSSDIRKHSRTV